MKLEWTIEPIRLDLKYTWKTSRNSSTFKQNYIIHAHYGKWHGIGEVAPNIRYGETPESIEAAFSEFITHGANQVHDLNDLETLLGRLHLPNALRFGIESAYIHMLCHAEKTSIYEMLNLKKPDVVHTSFSLPIMDTDEMHAFYKDNNLERFSTLKIKVNDQNMIDAVRAVSTISNNKLIVDANEAFTNPDHFLQQCHELKNCNILLMEQPYPAGMDDAFSYTKPLSPFPVFADESICAEADFDKLQQQFHGINMKLMKAGGYINGIKLLQEARSRNMKTMIGCMIETSLGISSALHLCADIDIVDLDGSLIINNEPYGLVSETNGSLRLNQ